MEKISSDILALINEAAVLVRAGKIYFANFAAQNLIGSDCTGKKAQAVFGPELTGCQASSFIAEILLGTVPCTCRVYRLGTEQLILFSPSKKPDSILNEPFLCTMRNSLMSVELAANLLRSRAELSCDSEALEKIALISRQYYRMSRLISNASFVTSDDGLSGCAVSSVNISALFGDIINTCSFFAGNVEIHSDLGSDIYLDCDANLTKKLLFNLISNCICHAKGCSAITVTLIDNPDSLVLSVSDDGCGIDPDSLHTVFERYRYGFSISEMGKGAGLGLTVARRIARMHGGTLLLESRKNIGTSVRVSLGKRLSPVHSLRSSAAEGSSLRDDALMELSDCIGPEFYSEKFMD